MRGFLNWAIGRWWRMPSVLLAFTLIAAAVAPFINAAPYAGSIQRALEASLGRKVSFREAHFTVLFGPGFSLSDVTIDEDPQFGVEPFAFVPTLDARVRLDRLLMGQIAFSSVRLADPSINLVRRADGDWNMVQLAHRISQARGVPLHLFPAVQISDGRLDFKLGLRKTNIYITDASLSVYGESGGKLYIQFEGSPARTDRAGNGFGHLSGHLNWYTHPTTAESNQLEGSITLDRSNLSELATLFRGEDAGVHGMVSGKARLAGPASALHLAGNLRFEDIHRWDLLPSSGEDWTVAYNGVINLPARSIDLKTVPASGTSAPVQLALKGDDFLSHPTLSVLANLNSAPVAALLPLARRMGLDLPENVNLDGAISGAVSYSTEIGWTGGVGITNFIASVPNGPPFRASTLQANIAPDRIQIASARITSGDSGWLDVGGDYDRRSKGLNIGLKMNEFPSRNLRELFNNWLQWPVALDALEAGNLTGVLDCAWTAETDAIWSGKFRMADGSVNVAGLSDPVTHVQGLISFNGPQVDLEQFSGMFGKKPLRGSLHYDGQPSKPAHLHVSYSGADLAELESLLSQSRRESWLDRLGLTQYRAPEWLMRRNLQADIDLPELTLGGSVVGDLRTHLRWAGTTMQLTAVRLRMAQGEITGAGAINLAGERPKYKLSGDLTGLPWRGGFLSVKGNLQASGRGSDLLRHVAAEGTFTGQDVQLSAEDEFDSLSGKFQVSLPDGWPDVRLTDIQASDGDEDWTGQAASSSDGKLVLDLQHNGQQRRVVSTLSPDTATSAAMR